MTAECARWFASGFLLGAMGTSLGVMIGAIVANYWRHMREARHA